MLNGVGLTQEFWVEVVDTTQYLVNKSPSSALVDSTPHEVWFCKNHFLSHLRVFSCDAFVHVPKENKNNLDNKEFKCIFIDYTDGLKGFNLWNAMLRKTNIYS